MAKGPNAVMLVLGEGRDEQTYWLEYSIDALIQLEDLTDEDAPTIMARMITTPNIKPLRAALWAGLVTHHPTIGLRAAGELLRLPGKDQVREKINLAFQKSFPDVKDRAATAAAEQEAGADADRPPGGGSAGTGSSEPG
ncbi:MAG TPA: hypothetical protein VFH92_14515 [Phenylobacterium sp.]|nr:hypothetical protein [Phenylobacterium sp.]